jgi:hypothetical protein
MRIVWFLLGSSPLVVDAVAVRRRFVRLDRQQECDINTNGQDQINEK